MNEQKARSFFDWIKQLANAETNFMVVTNELSDGGYGGGSPKATVAFDDCPDELVEAINNNEVRLDNARTVTDSAPFYTDEGPRACLDVYATDMFFR